MHTEIDPGSASDDLGRLFSTDELSDDQRAQLEAALESGSVEVWIGRGDLLPRRISVDITLSGEFDGVPLAGVEVGAQLDLSDYGDEKSINAPDDAQPLPLDDLARIVGG